jgi:hypothetical protein
MCNPNVNDRPVMLILTPLPDPLARRGLPPRDADYRLKLLLKRVLRDHGFRCDRCCDASKVKIITHGH